MRHCPTNSISLSDRVLLTRGSNLSPAYSAYISCSWSKLSEHFPPLPKIAVFFNLLEVERDHLLEVAVPFGTCLLVCKAVAHEAVIATKRPWCLDVAIQNICAFKLGIGIRRRSRALS